MSQKRLNISSAVQSRLKEARIARLSTLDAKSRPHIVPICFVYESSFFYSAIDQKPKIVAPELLVRLRNIRASSDVALLIDEYDEDWSQLWFILIRGRAKVMPMSARRERGHAICKLREKYPQYTGRMLAPDATIIRIAPERITSWGKI